jgi:UDP-GlcNAc:undecaprenyl-phosphate GlcNAc-1-phosphate transferase
MTTHPAVLLGIAFAASLVSIFFVLIITRHFGLFDTVDERKVHTGDIPRLGGVGIFAGFVLGLVVFWLFSHQLSRLGNNIWHLVAGSTLIFGMGVWDDLKPWRAKLKLLVQVVAAILVLSGGFTFQRITFGPAGFVWDMGIFRYLVTFCWIIGVTNALNLIDGIDGQAGMVSTLVVLSYAVMFYNYGNIPAMMVCLLLAVSIAGFLVFNLPFPKAKIFMGDGGSQFLGFALAVLPLMSNQDERATIGLPYAAALLMIPVFDTIAAIWRRVREKRRIDSPDKFHLHHKLIMMGFTSRHALIIVTLFQLGISLLVVSSGWIHGAMGTVMLFSVFLLGILFFTVIHIRKEDILEKTRSLKM